VLAAVAVLLRPTNLLIWLVVLGFTLSSLASAGRWSQNLPTLLVLLREILLCGLSVLTISLVCDRLYFGFWTFPPYKWLYFNISQSLAVFYGHMPWHYYLSQGIPLLTTTFLPFVLIGLYKAAKSSPSTKPQQEPVLQPFTLRTLAAATLAVLTILSFISHKEVRFIYPLLPILHILAAPYISAFFTQPEPAAASASSATPGGAGGSRSNNQRVSLRHTLALTNLLSLNLLIAGYLSLYHQPAPLSVLTFLRGEFERLHPDALHLGATAAANPSHTGGGGGGGAGDDLELFALFLTPCHSTPWRSHLVYPALRARALTCEPPLHTAPGSVERQEYLDEADRFYLRDSQEDTYGVRFLKEELWPGLSSSSSSSSLDGLTTTTTTQKGGEEIPRYIIGFEGIDKVLKRFFEGGQEEEGAPGSKMGVKLKKVWSAWNGAFNEDWRRRGRLVVWDTGVYPDPKREGKKE
jgi:phosphatidylinositol glycan class B